MAALSTLRIDFEANVARVTRDVQRIERMMQKRTRAMAKIASRAGTLIGLGLGAAFTGGLSRSIRAATDDLSDLANQAEKLGLGTDALQEFRFAAGQVGVNTRALDVGFQRFTRRSAEAAAGSKELARVFDQLNINLKDQQGNLRSSEDLFGDFMDALGGVENQSERVRLAFKLLDTEGVDLVRLAGRFSELREQARSMGVVIDRSVVMQAREAGDRLEALRTVIAARLNPVLAEMAPLLVNIAEGFAAALKWAKEFFNLDTGESPTIAGLEKQLANLEKQKQDLIQKAPLRLALEDADYGALQQQLDNLQQRIDLTRDKLRRLRESAADQPPAVGGFKPTDYAALSAEQKKLEDRAKALADSVRTPFEVAFDSIEELDRLMATTNMSQETYWRAFTAQLDAASEALDELPTALSRQRDVDLRVNIIADEIDATRVVQREIQQLQALLDDANLGEYILSDDQVDTVRTRMLDLQGDLDDILNKTNESAKETSKAALDMGFAFSSAFEDAILAGQEFSEVLRGLARDIAAIIIRSSITQPLGTAISSGITSILPWGGTRAAGGPVDTGKAYLVGEERPELFIPNRSGVIAPAAPGAAPVNVQVINNTQADVQTETGRQADGSQFVRFILNTVAQDMSSGGVTSRAMRGYGLAPQAVAR